MQQPKAPGSVTLVGAGPGDPELLTLKAVRAIANASLLLVDDLVNSAVLEHASATTRIVHVGKRGGCKSTPQAFITRMMVSAAQSGETVVRLKGGDPFVFGRGGEEVEELQTHGIRVEVINGISSGLAAVTSLGVPLTHREHAHGVVFVTGHAKSGTDGTDWKVLAQTAAAARLTIVIYMGISSARQIQAGLLQGLGADTPVAVVQNATLAHQRQAVTTLGALVQCIDREQLGSPAVIVVGDVVRGIQSAQAEVARARNA